MENEYHTHIESTNKLLIVNLKELWHYRDLILLFTKRSFVVTYKQTVLGTAWIILTLFITGVIYTIAFGSIAGISTNGVPQLLFYMGNNVVWMYFAAGFDKTASTLTSNARVYRKIYFPRLIMPILTVFSVIFNFVIQICMFRIFFVYYRVIGEIYPNWFALPLLLLVVFQLGCLGLGRRAIVSNLTTKYIYLAIVVTFGVQLWMYASQVICPMSQLTNPFFEFILHINSTSATVEMFRYVMLGVGEIGVWWLLVIIIIVVFLFFRGMLFNKVEKTFIDIV